jgi:hypothetical protein
MVAIRAKGLDGSSIVQWTTLDSSASGVPYTVGSVPKITAVIPGINNLTVKFNPSLGGNPSPPYYYYSLDGITERLVENDASFIFIPNLQGKLQGIAIRAKGLDASMNVRWISSIDISAGTPYFTGSTPIINSINPGANKLTVSFSQSTVGTSPTNYYYSESSDGTNRVGPVTSPFDISNITTQKTIYIVATNIAGTLVSVSAQETPYTIGTPPSIISVTPGDNSLIVQFAGSTGGNPTPSYYYYALDGGNYINAIVSNSRFTIPKLTGGTSYIVTMVAQNNAGFTSTSNSMTGIPRDSQSILYKPVITYIASDFTELHVYFDASYSGHPPTSFSYSLNNDTYILANETSSPIIISGLDEDLVYSVTIKSHNDYGDSLPSTSYLVMTLSSAFFYRDLYKNSIRRRSIIIGPNPINNQKLLRTPID